MMQKFTLAHDAAATVLTIFCIVTIATLHSDNFHFVRFFSLRHFGYLSNDSIETPRNSAHYTVFSDIMIELA